MRLTSAQSRYTRGQTPAYVVKTESARKLAIYAGHTALRRRLRELNPQRGDTIEVTYLGSRKPKSGRHSFHHYRVSCSGSDDDKDQNLRRVSGYSSGDHSNVMCQTPQLPVGQPREPWPKQKSAEPASSTPIHNKRF